MRLVPFGMLAAAAAWLALRWEDLPSRWIAHWGPGGVPNGWATKTFGEVFGPLLLAAALAIFLELLAVFLERLSRARYPKLAQAYGNFVRWVSMAVVASISVLAILLPSPTPPPPLMFAPLILGAVALALVAGAWGLVRATRQIMATGESLPKGYSPLFYRNPDDPRIMVPKLVGVGWTLNFAHRTAWLVLALLLLPAIVAIIVVLVVA